MFHHQYQNPLLDNIIVLCAKSGENILTCVGACDQLSKYYLDIVYGNIDGYAKSTTTFIQQVRDRNEGVNVVGFRILPAKRLSEFVARFADYSHYDEVQQQWRKQKSAIIPFPKGYSALYAISSKDIEEDVEFEVKEGAKKADISRAFKKMLKSKSTNKKLLSSFVDQIA